MTVKGSIAAAIIGLIAGVGCSSGGDSPAVTPATQAGGVITTTTTAAPAAKASFDPQAYCVEKLRPLAVKYPKSLGGSDLAAECSKMIRETDASSAKTIDALLETSEGYYKMIG